MLRITKQFPPPPPPKKKRQTSHFKAQPPQKRRNGKPRGGSMRKHLNNGFLEGLNVTFTLLQTFIIEIYWSNAFSMKTLMSEPVHPICSCKRPPSLLDPHFLAFVVRRTNPPPPKEKTRIFHSVPNPQNPWKPPRKAFLLTVDNLSLFAYNWSFFAYNFTFFAYNWSFLAYSGKVRLIKALRHCKQRSLTVSKKLQL